MIELKERDGGVVLSVKARAGASRNAITGAHDGMLKISVTQAPEKGKANVAMISLLSKSLDLSKSQIGIVSGLVSSHKEFLISGISLPELRDRLDSIL